jgi:hypothetical protein
MPRFRKSSHAREEFKDGRHRFEHWYRDNTIYFITARCRDGFPAFKCDGAKLIFWDRFGHYANEFGFDPWLTTLLDNHYHTVGHLRIGANLGRMMQRLHGSVAKLVNDLLTQRRVPFWKCENQNDYFDGCLRDEMHYRRAYRYTLMQAVRAGLVRDWRLFPHTRVCVGLEAGLTHAVALGAFLPEIEYPRYTKARGRR